MKILHIYDNFNIMPNLQMHMVRAAAVGLYIMQNWNDIVIIDKKTIISTLLLHDLGNIIKFELRRFPTILGNEFKRIDYWESVQKDFIKLYGEQEHLATVKMASTLQINRRVLELVQRFVLSNVKEIAEKNNYDVKICAYSDMRVAPHGVVSINERFDDLVLRYTGRKLSYMNNTSMQANRNVCIHLETQIQRYCSAVLSKITNTSIAPLIPEIQNYDIDIVA